MIKYFHNNVNNEMCQEASKKWASAIHTASIRRENEEEIKIMRES